MTGSRAAVGGEPATRRSSLLAGAVVLCLITGVVLRAWFLAHHQMSSDEAVPGLMAEQILHGHFFTFYWGQRYGGAEPYVVAAVLAVTGPSEPALRLTPILLWLAGSVLVWAIARRGLSPSRRVLALAAGAACWAGPAVVLFDSTRELGFRGAAEVALLASVLFADRMAEHPTLGRAGLLGLALGVGWWASPEIAYAVPVVAVAVAPALRRPVLRNLGAAAGGFLSGSLPWWYTNLTDGMRSLQVSSSPSYVRSTYTGRLGVWFVHALPMMLGLRAVYSGAWLWSAAGWVLYVLALVGLVVTCALGLAGWGPEPGRRLRRATSAGLVVFPLVFAAFPATSLWTEGQYGLYAVPLLVLQAALFAGALADRRVSPGPRLAGATALALVAACAVSFAGFVQYPLGGHAGRLVTGWGNPESPLESFESVLEADGVRYAVGEYWTAYDLDFLSKGRLEVTDPQIPRWTALNHRVLAQPLICWIFTPAPLNGTDGYTQVSLERRLRALGIGWRVVSAGGLTAVLLDRPMPVSAP